MQQSWRNDADKLTFIMCRPAGGNNSTATATSTSNSQNELELSLTDEDDSSARMIGDINLFLRVDDGDEGVETPEIIGEIELMVAEKKDQGRGFGRAALLAFLRYVLEREGEVVGEFVSGDEGARNALGDAKEMKFAALSVKIGQGNERSLKLFESLGFKRVGEEPNYFGEWELRRTELRSEEVDGYREVGYTRTA